MSVVCHESKNGTIRQEQEITSEGWKEKNIKKLNIYNMVRKVLIMG